MKRILLVFSTREGHTRRVVEYIEGALLSHGLEVDRREVRELTGTLDLKGFSAVILAASVHLGRHAKEMVRFVKEHRDQLERLPSAFLSVCLSQADALRGNNTPERRAEATRQVAAQMDDFFDQTAWHPDRAEAVAGALLYSEYNLLLRWVMKRIAGQMGASTDTSHDHVYTDWQALDRFVGDFVGAAGAPTAAAVAEGL